MAKCNSWDYVSSVHSSIPQLLISPNSDRYTNDLIEDRGFFFLMNGRCTVLESICFRTTGKIKFQCNFHYILPNAEPGTPGLQCAPLSKCLLTFDHADIIGSIADGQSDSISVLLHKLYYLGFLERGDSAADHRLTHAGKF